MSRAGALFVMQDTGWDHALKVTGDGDGLVGHAGAVLLRKLADQAGLTGALGSALARAGKFPLVDRGIALVSMAVAIALGATSMNDITPLAHPAPVLGAEPSDTTVRRTLELAPHGPVRDPDGRPRPDPCPGRRHAHRQRAHSRPARSSRRPRAPDPGLLRRHRSPHLAVRRASVMTPGRPRSCCLPGPGDRLARERSHASGP